MTARDKNTIKGYFQNGKTPNGDHYADLVDSYMDYGSIGQVATGAEVDTGTDNVKYTSPKSIRDSGLISGAVSGEISGLTDKATPVDADVILGENSANSFSKIKISWANLKATLNNVYAAYAKGVTNGDSHDHNGGDGASITEMGLHLNDVTTHNVGTTQHGFVPKAPNSIFQFLRGDGNWSLRAGTSFPGSPTTGQEFFRTDLGFDCFWNGTYWVTKDLFTASMSVLNASANGSGGGVALWNTYQFYVERVIFQIKCVGTQDATNYWTVYARSINNGYSAATTIYSFVTTGLSPNIFYDKSGVPTVRTDATNKYWLDIAYNKTNSPGDIGLLFCTFFYRLIVS